MDESEPNRTPYRTQNVVTTLCRTNGRDQSPVRKTTRVIETARLGDVMKRDVADQDGKLICTSRSIPKAAVESAPIHHK